MSEFTWSAMLPSLVGGIIIGFASWLLLAALGRVTGISGIASALLPPATGTNEDKKWRLAFMFGLIVVGGLAAWGLGVPEKLALEPSMQNRSFLLLAVAGAFVGFGTVLGSGCTSGHGICGLGRRSMRSLMATATFMATGMLTVTAMKFWF